MPKIEQAFTNRIPRDESTADRKEAWKKIERTADRGPKNNEATRINGRNADDTIRR